MSAVATAAEVRLNSSGGLRIETTVRLSCHTRIDCYVYDESAPILILVEGDIGITVTVPDTGKVTGSDVARGRLLAEAAATYAAALEQRAAADRDAAGDGAAA
jgi:hypothetical protein